VFYPRLKTEWWSEGARQGVTPLPGQPQPMQLPEDQTALVSVTWHRPSGDVCQRSLQMGSLGVLGY